HARETSGRPSEQTWLLFDAGRRKPGISGIVGPAHSLAYEASDMAEKFQRVTRGMDQTSGGGFRSTGDHRPSRRELEVVRLVDDGNSNKQIAATLNLSTRTVETYRARIMLKLNVRSVAEVVRYAVRTGIVQP